MSFLPLISIIIPTFNRASLLVETLTSIKHQTYKNWECIIVDDGSTDNTNDVVKEFIHDDNRFSYHHRSTCRANGGNGARNDGFLKSKGDYIKWLDSDDLLTNTILELEVNELKNFDCDIVLSSWQYFDNSKNPFPIRNKLIQAHPKSGIELLNLMGKLGEFSYPSCYLVKRDLVVLAGLWNESLRINQDGEFFFRILLNAKLLNSIDVLGTLHRKDGDNKVSQKRDNESIQKRLNSWKLIDSHIKLPVNHDLGEYIDGTKTILYNELRSTNLWKIILENEDFFSTNLKEEKSRKAKLKILMQRLK